MQDGFTDFRHLMRLRAQTAWNIVRSLPTHHRVIHTIFGIGAAVVFVLVLVGFAGFLNGARKHDPTLANQLIERVVFMLFLFLFAGGLPFVSGVLLTPGDLSLLAASPLRPPAVVAARLIDATWAASAQFLVIGVPLLLGSGYALGFGLLEWLVYIPLLLLFLMLPALLVALLLLLMARILGIRRVKLAVSITSAILSLLLCLLMVKEFSQRSTVFSTDIAVLTEAARTIPPVPAWIPSSWVADAMIALEAGNYGQVAAGLGLLLLVTGVVFALCVYFGGPLLIGESLLEGDGSGATGQKRGLADIFLSLLPLSPPVRALIAKDARYVARDLVLLSQIGIPLILYFVPYVIGAQLGPTGQGDIFILSLSIVGMILYMECSIFGLSSIGLEGRGFWLILSAPITMPSLIFAKWFSAVGAALTIVLPLYLISCVAYRAEIRYLTIGLPILILNCCALCGLSVGISGLFPRFVYDNPAHRASVSALIWGFFSATAYLLISGVVLGGSLWASYNWPERGTTFFILGGVLFVILAVGASTIPLLTARARLEGYPWEE